MSNADTSRLLDELAGYFTAKLEEHGGSARGVDWNGEESQHNRFAQLMRIVEGDGPFSINDLGCGYGAMIDYIAERHPNVTYYGYDISERMVEAAAAKHTRRHFEHAATPTKTADYGVASGIFNVCFGMKEADFLQHIHATLDAMHATSTRGFAFNCLTSYSDADRMRPDLYYADPCAMFNFCKRRYSRQVALLHDYGLYDFTILVRKSA